MIRLACCLLLICCTSVVALAGEGWTSLLNDLSLEGWTQRGGEATYRVEESTTGELVVVGTTKANTPNTFLCTNKHYGDFVLEFEVKVNPKLNSGVQFRSLCFDEPTQYGNKQVPAGRVHGYQAEIDPSERAYSGGIYDEARRGWLYKLDGDDHADARAAFDPEGWNKYRIEAKGATIKTWVNGVQAAKLTDDLTPKGFIALQVHGIGSAEQEGLEIRWRNLRIKSLDPANPAADSGQ